jgi:hypothetical protein
MKECKKYLYTKGNSGVKGSEDKTDTGMVASN